MISSPSGLAREDACISSALLPQAQSISAPAVRGTELHAFMAACAAPAGRAAALLRVPVQWRAAAEAIDFDRLPAINPNTGVAELAIAWNPKTGTARELARGGILTREEIRALAKEGEMVGTIDWCALTESEVVIHDWKMGWASIDPAADNWQLGAYAVFAAKLLKRERAVVAITRILDGGKVWHDTATLDDMDLEGIEAKLRTHLSRVESGRLHFRASGKYPPMIEGAHCRYCPAAPYCPAKVALALSVFKQGNETPAMFVDRPLPMTAEVVADLYPKVLAAEAMLEKLKSALTDFARHQPVTLANGLVLTEVDVSKSEIDPARARTLMSADMLLDVLKTEESITKAAVSAALRKRLQPGEKITHVEKAFYEDLEKEGALKHTSFKRVEAVKPSSKKLAAKNAA